MLESITLGRSLTDKEYKAQAAKVQYELFQAQRKLIDKKIPLLIQVAGVSGGGRGYVVNLLNEWLDNKVTHTFGFWDENDLERNHPTEWRFWRRMPGEGETAIFYDGWYALLCRDRACGKISDRTFTEKVLEYKDLERTLTCSGMALVKIWLHLDTKQFDKIERRRAKKKELRAYTPYDKRLAEHYKEHISAVEKAIELTDTANAPWTLIDASDTNYRNIAVAKAVIEAIENALSLLELREQRLAHEKKVKAKAKKTVPSERVGLLSKVDLTQTIDKEPYLKELAQLQEKVRKLSFQAYQKGISSTLLFEGWDAAGKGSTIRRLLGGLDCRITKVVPIAAPSSEEKAHHYLWRFWRHIPQNGFVTIFDRTWYGRVLVERVEKFTPVEDWTRAYAEINAFERRLTGAGNIVLKFWLQISPEEQLRRFKERQVTLRKQYKITDEDWRNRDKWPDYEAAVEEMLHRTNTEAAPWYVVPSENKMFARLFVLRAYVAALKKALKARR